MNKIYLFPGKLAVCQEPTEITTILGSCVAVALYDPETRIGGLNHYLLPSIRNDDCQNPRYGVYAIPELIKQITNRGVPRSRILAKVYGGGSVIGEVSEDLEVGNKNIEAALDILNKEGIKVIDKNIGGIKGRRIVLNTATFEVKHQFMGQKETTVDTTGYQKLDPVKRCKVLIIDDSATVRALFQKIFTKHGLTVVGVAANAFEARELLVKSKPDVMTLDIEMPMMSGVKFLEKIMEHMPTPTVMVSSLGSQGEAALKSLELGAVEFIQKPSQHDVNLLSQLGESLVEKVRAAASVNVIRLAKSKVSDATTMSHQYTQVSSMGFNEIKVIGVSGNAGAQIGLEKLMRTLPADTPPVVVSVSTITTFLKTYVEKLSKTHSHLNFFTAENGISIQKGCVYFAPANYHMQVKKNIYGGTIELSSGLAVNLQIPSGNVLFESLAKEFPGCSLGIQLSGYGNDGVTGLGMLQSKKSVTMVEDPQNTNFPYVPQHVIAQGFAEHILDVSQMSAVIMNYRNRRAA